jgi:hypothetical protein
LRPTVRKLRSARLGRKANRLVRKDVILKPDGSVEKPERKLDKQAIITTFGLQPRDLRSLDAHILDVRPSLLVCKRSIVLCTPIARAIIAYDQMVLIASDSANPICSPEGADEVRCPLELCLSLSSS